MAGSTRRERSAPGRLPDDVRTGDVGWVRYDLPRFLAVLATRELDGLLLPPDRAAWIVERAFPELCRAVIAAASDAGLIRRPAAMPASAGPVVTLYPDAFAAGAAANVVAARTGRREVAPAGVPLLVIDGQRFITALAAGSGAPPAGMAEAFESLELAFGWTAPELPAAITPVADLHREGGTFLERGPFFERATALLRAPAEAFGRGRPHSRERLQALLDYVLDPAPVDAWKGMVGDVRPGGRPGLRLHHLLSFFGAERGLSSSRVYPEHLGLAAVGAVDEMALDYIARAEAAAVGAARADEPPAA